MPLCIADVYLRVTRKRISCWKDDGGVKVEFVKEDDLILVDCQRGMILLDGQGGS